MKCYLPRFFMLVTLLPAVAGELMAQAADISLPKQREKTIETASAVLAARSAPVVLPKDVPNPFQWPVDESNIEVAPTMSKNVAPVMGKEFLARLASQIPATGTAILGGQSILLLGQKRLKVGDTITISFEGQDYDLSITDIASTSFTVKRGELIYTRPTHISSSSRP